MKLIPKCQNNSGNAFGNIAHAIHTQEQLNRTRQKQAEALNDSNKPIIQNSREGIELMTGLKFSKDTAARIDADTAYKTAVSDEVNYYNSPEYKSRLLRAGAELSNSTIQANLVKLANHGYLNESEASAINKSSNSTKAGMKSSLRAVLLPSTIKIGNRTLGPGVYFNTGSINNDVYGTWAHELSHFSDRKLTDKAKAWNHKLIEGNLATGTNSYYGSDTEIRARALPIMLHYRNNKNTYGSWKNFIKANKDNKSVNELRKTFKDDTSFDTYMLNFVQNDNPPKDLRYEITEEQPMYGKTGGIINYFL